MPQCEENPALAGARGSVLRRRRPCSPRRSRPTSFRPSELTPGMKGYGFSDLGDGKGVQRFDVEILGLLKSYAPKQDLILARVVGRRPREDRRHRGDERQPDLRRRQARRRARLRLAVLARTPICGITPIQSMLDIRKAPAAPPVPIGGAADASGGVRLGLPRPARSPAPFEALLAPLKRASPRPPGLAPLPLPVSLSGPVDPGRPLRRRRRDRGLDGARRPGASSPGRGRRRRTPRRASSPVPRSPRMLLSGDMDPLRDGHGDVGRRQLACSPSATRSSRWVPSTCRWRAPTS